MRCRISITYSEDWTTIEPDRVLPNQKYFNITAYYYNNDHDNSLYNIGMFYDSEEYNTNNQNLNDLLNKDVTEIIYKAKYNWRNSRISTIKIDLKESTDNEILNFGKIDLSLYKIKEKKYKVKDLCYDKLNNLIISNGKKSNRLYFDIEC